MSHHNQDIGFSDMTDNNEELLKAMGFNDEEEIKKALCLSNNDINEAVAYLTNEKTPKITTINNMSINDIDMADTNLPGSPKETKESNQENPLIFPVECLIQLENNVFTESWSIPYKKDEWLGRLLVSAIALVKEGLAEADSNCKRFLDRVVPEVYRKLLDSMPVNKWNNEIQTGVYNMTCMAIELIALKLKEEVPELLLNTLTLIFNPDSTFHNKNAYKIWDKSQFVEELGGVENLYTKDLDTNGWLLNFINIELNSLLKPLAICSGYINSDLVSNLFETSMQKILEKIKKLEGEDFKDKNAGRVFDLLNTIKKFSVNIWKTSIESFHKMHLSVVLNMLKYPHFNSKMNSLKEICKLIENASSSLSTSPKLTIKAETLSEWIISERILSLAVEGNIDQSQYCDKIKTIVEFIGNQIKNEEISALWQMQYNKSMSIIDNLYVIIGIAATKFDPEQLDFLITQIIQTWNNSSFKLHDKLVGLLRIIGREAKNTKTWSRILEALWELKNRAGLSRQLLLLIYSEHLSVLSGARVPRDAVKKEYIKKCCDEIKKVPGSTVAIASLKHMHDILNSYQKNANKALKDVLTELVVPIMKNLCTSLLKCHANAYEKTKQAQQAFDESVLIDATFTHEEVVQTHLNSMKFILQEGNLYLNLNRAQDIWEVLIANEHSCEWDKKIGFEWFIDCWPDLNEETRAEIFKKQILCLKPASLTQKGYECFKLYFIRVNEQEGKSQIRSDVDNFFIEKLDLTGLNFLWDVILYVNDEKIADLATKFLLEISYEKVSLRLKRESVELHQRFINECYARLENCLVTLDSSPIGQLLINAFRITYASVAMNEMANVPIAPRSQTLKCIERLLMIAERYIVAVEEGHSLSRSNQPHFLTFKSESFSLVVSTESKPPIEMFVCSNETLGELRSRIAAALNVQPSSVQINHNEKPLGLLNDTKLLVQLGIDGMSPINVKIAYSSLNQTPVKDSSVSFGSRYDPDSEKSLPGVLIANGGSAFDMLHRLQDLDEPKIKQRVRNILKLIPTDPKLLDTYDRVIGRVAGTSSATSNSSTASVAAASGMVKSPSVSSISNPPQTQYSSSACASSSSSHSTPATPTFSSTLSKYAGEHTVSLSQVTSSATAAMNSFLMKKTDSTSSVTSNCSKDFGKFFNQSTPLHRILYHLEALCSRLMPSDSNSQQSADVFLQDFLKANGLEILTSLLKLENFKSQNDYETKQDIYILLLQLLRLIFFGSYYPAHAVMQMGQPNHKRPSTEPIGTCAKKTVTPAMLSTSNGNESNLGWQSNLLSDATLGQDSKVLSVIQKMSVNEVMDLIQQLLMIFWSAAAGNLELAAGVNTTPTPMSPGNWENASVRSPRVSSMCSLSSSSKSFQQKIKSATSPSSNGTLMNVDDTRESFNTSVTVAISEEIDVGQAQETDNIELNLNKSLQKEVKFFIPDHRLSTGSNMSTSSIDSTDTSMQNFSPSLSSNLYPSVCIKQTSVSNKDIKIASKSIELIACFLQYRRDCLDPLLANKLFNDCVIDALTGSISSEVRAYAEHFLLKIAHLDHAQPPLKCKEHLINLIIKTRLPLWNFSSLTRPTNQRLIAQSTQFFNLRSALLENMSLDEQSAFSIDLSRMLSDEVNWLLHFTPTRTLREIDNTLLTGHLDLTRALLTCQTANKADIGSDVISVLFKNYLFPAAYLINNPSEENHMEPICSNESSRLAAYRLFVELSKNCFKNFQKISHQLIAFHHQVNSSIANDWNYIPLVTPRADCGFVGLKNGGATCYMNAVLQQLFMLPGVPEYLLSIEDESDKKSVFCQLQNVFAHLKESKLEYYSPESFWRAFRMWGQEVNIREQQDAFDFFISMTDQIDEHLKKSGKEPIFKNVFEGTFSNQFICKDCPHRYERDEAFLGLNLPIKAGNLQESLQQFVKDELLDGENSYNCEKCNEKRSAIKRTCIKKLPKYLCIQLKRFDYDWESNRSLKFDDYFEFPRTLDVSPYVYESINKARGDNNLTSVPNNTKEDAGSFKRKVTEPTGKEVLYELVGVVVHSGQANAGHYYSFIKGFKNDQSNVEQEICELEQLNQSMEEDKIYTALQQQQQNESERKEPESNQKWYKFNDTSVEEITMTETALIEECFGGTFTQTSDYKMLPEERARYWNGYMLFYREPNYNRNFQQSAQTKAANKSIKQRRENPFGLGKRTTNDSLSELAELVSRGDEKGLFRTFLPHSIEQTVKSENLEFCKNRSIYDPHYFQFIYNLVKIFKENNLGYEENGKSKEIDQFVVECCNLGLEFLYNTFFKTGKKLRSDLRRWLDLFDELLAVSKEGSVTMLNFIVNHESQSGFIRHYLLECPVVEIREACGELFEYCLRSLVVKYEFQPLTNPKISSLISSCVQLLDKAVIDLCKYSQEYFRFLYNYAEISKETTQQLITLGIFNKLLCFLLGNPGTLKSEETSNRRWSNMQSREFSIVHELIAIILLKCNILSMKTCEIPESSVQAKPDSDSPKISVQESEFSEPTSDIQLETLSPIRSTPLFHFQPPTNSAELIPLTQEMQIYLIGPLSNRYLKELVFAFEQINPSSLNKTLEMILACCYCNEVFSANMIHQILNYINNSSSNEIKQVLSLLNYIILIDDPLQLKRLRLVIDGYKDNLIVYNGLLSIIRQNQSSDAKKSYQCVKFIVTLANKSSSCKEFLLKTANNWEWSVNWLKSKMLESLGGSSYNWPSKSSNEDSDTRTFQRTKSAQRTLDDATALLQSNEFDI